MATIAELEAIAQKSRARLSELRKSRTVIQGKTTMPTKNEASCPPSSKSCKIVSNDIYAIGTKALEYANSRLE
ncbi:MAG: hypothetical protein IKZ87_00860 [Actinomycetaceae bacterium]|nr:hypothetical protein [Actinomycetaceae bacterium]